MARSILSLGIFSALARSTASRNWKVGVRIRTATGGYLDLTRHPGKNLAAGSISDGEARAVDSYVYWNGPDGFSVDRRTALPTVGASDVEVVDLDGDGWRDLVFANRYDGGSAAAEESYQVDVWAYLGGPDGYNATWVIPGFGAAQTAVADFDQDGTMNMAIAAGTFHTTESWVYFGADGWAEAGRVALATAAPEGVIAADLDDDGWVDLAFANFYAMGELEIDSTVYWGGPDGFADSTPFPTTGADNLVAIDVDGDGCRELAVANAMEGTFFEMDFAADSALWSFAGREITERATFPTMSAAALAAGDVDGDGHTDLVFANRYDAAGDASGATSAVFYGPGYTESRAIPVVAAAGVAFAGAE